MCAWLHEQGLGLYVAQCQSWIKSGQTLLQASQHDLEKVRVRPHSLRLRVAAGGNTVGSEVSDSSH